MRVKDTTLGQNQVFAWSVDDAGGIEVWRQFRKAAGEQTVVSRYTSKDLDLLHAYVAERAWTDLANNVEKLYRGTEKEGLGKFIQDSLGKSRLDAQAASQLAALFVKAGAWESNGKLRGMAFRSVQASWSGRIRDYYECQKQAQARADGV